MAASLMKKGRGSGRRGRRRSNSPMTEINVTPFVDVMLVLLIVFMVAAPLLTSGVEVDLPESKAPAVNTPDDTPIEITLTKDNMIFIGESEVKEERLVALLSAITEGDLERRIYIRGDQGIPYGRIMRILGGINNAGFKKVALLSDPSRN